MRAVKTLASRKRASFLAGLVLLAVFSFAVWSHRRELRSWYSFWSRFESLARNAQGYPEYRNRQTGIIFVALPGGVFLMGSTDRERREAAEEFKQFRKSDPGSREWAYEETSNEQPAHQVSLSPFLIAKYEVSQAEWRKVMGTNPSLLQDDDSPVENVTWDLDCQVFCRRTGLALPSEAQWEYACRAGKSGSFSGTGRLQDMGWSFHDTGNEPHHRRGEKLPNEFGLYDMHGNVGEWVQDVYDAAFYSREEALRLDPICNSAPAGDNQSHVVRGGANPLFARSAARNAANVNMTGNDVGFRPVFAPR
jgi:formylglycine-generating enzyme required for sulfatase activity